MISDEKRPCGKSIDDAPTCHSAYDILVNEGKQTIIYATLIYTQTKYHLVFCARFLLIDSAVVRLIEIMRCGLIKIDW